MSCQCVLLPALILIWRSSESRSCRNHCAWDRMQTKLHERNKLLCPPSNTNKRTRKRHLVRLHTTSATYSTKNNGWPNHYWRAQRGGTQRRGCRLRCAGDSSWQRIQSQFQQIWHRVPELGAPIPWMLDTTLILHTRGCVASVCGNRFGMIVPEWSIAVNVAFWRYRGHLGCMLTV